MNIGLVGLPGLSIDGPKGHIGDVGYQGTEHKLSIFNKKENFFFVLKTKS